MPPFFFFRSIDRLIDLVFVEPAESADFDEGQLSLLRPVVQGPLGNSKIVGQLINVHILEGALPSGAFMLFNFERRVPGGRFELSEKHGS